MTGNSFEGWERELSLLDANGNCDMALRADIENSNGGETGEVDVFKTPLQNTLVTTASCNNARSLLRVELEADVVDSIISRCFLGNDGCDDVLEKNEIPFFSLSETCSEDGFSGTIPLPDLGKISEEKRRGISKRELEVVLSPTPRPPQISNAGKRAVAGGGDKREGCSRKRKGNKKSRKSRAPARPWTDEEQERFEQSLELYGRNWEKCAQYIGTRRAQLVRSHAQKHLIKLWKLGKALPKKVAESGNGYTLSGKPLLADSASARSYLTKIPCPVIAKRRD